MRSYNYKDKISAVLEKTDTYWSLDKPLQEIKLANEEWRVLLGDESYDNLFALLEKGGFSNPCSRTNCYSCLTVFILFLKVHPISEETWNKKGDICALSPRMTNPIMSMALRILDFI